MFSKVSPGNINIYIGRDGGALELVHHCLSIYILIQETLRSRRKAQESRSNSCAPDDGIFIEFAYLRRDRYSSDS